jgi:O-antigen ligase
MSPLSTSERLALAALAAAWVVPAWWLGASTVYGQAFAMGTGALAVVLALIVRNAAPLAKAEGWVGTAVPRPPQGLPRSAFSIQPSAFSLLPSAFIAAFLGLLLCQALNPDRILIPGRPVGLLRPLDHLAWLPTGIAGPFDTLPRDFLPFANAWRHLLIAGAVVLPLAALALLPLRPAMLRALLGLLFIHAVLFSAFAFVHNLSGSTAVLWLVHDTINFKGAPQFLGKNQQGSYQLLLLAAALAAWQAPAVVRPWTQLRHRNRWLAAGTALVFLGSVTTRSRAGLAGAVLLALAAAALALWPHRHHWRTHRRALVAAALAGLVAMAAIFSLPPVRATVGRLAEQARNPGDLLVGGSYRRILHTIAWEMTLDRPWFGHGAGCYLLLFPEYQSRVPAFMEWVRRTQPNWNRPVHVYADGDWVQFAAEYGLAGTALLALPWLAWLFALQCARTLGPGTALLALGPVLVLAHGCIDFVLRNPAILGFAAGLAALALALSRLQSAPQ